MNCKSCGNALDTNLETEELCERIKYLESQLRDQEITFLFGADVMNKIVLKKTHEITAGETPLAALIRWLSELDKMKTQREAALFWDEAGRWKEHCLEAERQGMVWFNQIAEQETKIKELSTRIRLLESQEHSG